MTHPIADPLVEVPDTESMSDLVRIDATFDGLVTVTINRPEKRNAFNAELIAALRDAFETLQAAEAVRAVFLMGEGEAFSAGADLHWMASAAHWSEAENREDAHELARMLKALYDLPALTVALVAGPAFGGGAGLVAACDMAVATESAEFAFSEVRLGLTPATISPYVIQAVGPRTARRLFATGDRFGALEAERFGLVQQVVADKAALDHVKHGLGLKMAANAPGAVGDAKALVRDLTGVTIDQGLIEETARRIASRRVSDEGREGVQAFLDKRRPLWAQ